MTARINEIFNDKGKRTAFDLLAGTVLYDITALVIGGIVRAFYTYDFTAYILGVLLGMAVACFMVIHMYAVLEKAILCDKKQAKRKTKLGALLRMFIMVLALILGAIFPEHLSIIGVIAGIFMLKIAALTQPLIDRFFSKFVKKEE